jgi:hypothetical protein
MAKAAGWEANGGEFLSSRGGHRWGIYIAARSRCVAQGLLAQSISNLKLELLYGWDSEWTP